MITVITGGTGTGKTWYAFNKMLYPEWKKGGSILTNQPATFPNENERVTNFEKLEEIFDAKNGTIFIDEAHKLFPAGGIDDFPPFFWDQITEHRKHRLDFVTTTQDLAQIHINYRRLIHDLYTTNTVVRFPANERFLPWLHIIKVVHRKRRSDIDTQAITWYRAGTKYYFISTLNIFRKSLYDTYKNVGLKQFICKGYLEKSKWKVKFYNRVLMRGRRKI